MRIVKTTVNYQKDAERISDTLIASGLAKCVTWHRTNSEYLWKGTRISEPEFELEAKCADKDAAKAAALVEKLHPYDVPMILVLDVKGVNRAYEKWLAEKKR